MTDYDSILRRAVDILNPNTAEARRNLYDRARRMLADKLRGDGASDAGSKLDVEIAAFDAAVERIEAELAPRAPAHWTPPGRRGRPSPEQDTPELDDRVSRPASRRLFPVLISALCVAAALGVMIASYQFLMKPTAPTAPSSAGGNRVPNDPRVARSTDTDDELEPGVDGGSTDAGLPYYFRRQPVYYRTVYSVGMILIDRSQRFLYLVQPKIMALRYGIGVGGECSASVGLLHVTEKREWPEWVPSPDLLRRRSYPQRVAGGPGNPLGARWLALDGKALGIHGTNAPKTIGHAVSVGCFRMVNDDIVDLYQRVSTGAAVVIMN